MRIQESAENYLEAILILKKERGYVRSIDIANYLEYSKPSVSVAMKKLRENGFIVTDADGLIALTAKGLSIADKMLERHTVISDWLIKLGVSEETALDDACKIEHVLSEETFEAIKSFAEKHENSAGRG